MKGINGITIKDKQYIFIKIDGHLDCEKCDLKDVCGTSMMCQSMYSLVYRDFGNGIFKELKVEK